MSKKSVGKDFDGDGKEELSDTLQAKLFEVLQMAEASKKRMVLQDIVDDHVVYLLPNPKLSHLHALYAKYEPKYYFFECVHLSFKIFYTGVLVFIARGSPVQLTVGIFSAISYMFICGQMQPYQQWREDLLWGFCLVSMFIAFFAGFMVSHGIEPESGFAGTRLGHMLAAVSILPFVIAGFLFWSELRELRQDIKSQDQPEKGKAEEKQTLLKAPEANPVVAISPATLGNSPQKNAMAATAGDKEAGSTVI